MIRAVVVDDEPLARTSLGTLLRRDPEIEVIAECSGGEEAIASIRRMQPDLVFLDVEMPECDGFDVLEALGGATPHVVFVTAFDRYALRAFEEGALDYLLKPFDDARFARALERAKARVAAAPATPRAPEKLAIKGVGGVSFVKVADIDWIEAADYYTRLHTGGKSHLLRRSMADLEGELDPTVFCRIHRSAIVRLERIDGLTLNESGEYDVRLGDGSTHPLSRRYRKKLRALLPG